LRDTAGTKKMRFQCPKFAGICHDVAWKTFGLWLKNKISGMEREHFVAYGCLPSPVCNTCIVVIFLYKAQHYEKSFIFFITQM